MNAGDKAYRNTKKGKATSNDDSTVRRRQYYYLAKLSAVHISIALSSSTPTYQINKGHIRVRVLVTMIVPFLLFPPPLTASDDCFLFITVEPQMLSRLTLTIPTTMDL